MMTGRFWIILAGLLLIIAAVFLWRNNLSAAFVTAAAGACAWFLSYRVQLRRKGDGNEIESSEPPANEESDEK